MELHKRIGEARTAAEYQVLADELSKITSDKPEDIMISCISFIYNSHLEHLITLVESDEPDEQREFLMSMRGIARRAALTNFNRSRSWIGDSFDKEDDVRFLLNKLLAFNFDFRCGWMNKPEPFLWCVLLGICLRKLVEIKSFISCSKILKIFEEVEYSDPWITGDLIEQIIGAEFIETHEEPLVHIINFLRKNKINVANTQMCVVSIDSYEMYEQLLSDYMETGKTGKTEKNGKNGKTKGLHDIQISRVQDMNDNGTKTTRKVYYSFSEKVFYCYRNGIKYPVIPDVLMLVLMEKLHDRKFSNNADEINAAEAMRERVMHEQNAQNDE